MPFTLSKDDLAFLEQVQRLGESGLTQRDIAAELGLSEGSLRYRVNRLGFEMVPSTTLRTTLSRRPLPELVECGEILATDDQPSVEAEAAAA